MITNDRSLFSTSWHSNCSDKQQHFFTINSLTFLFILGIWYTVILEENWQVKRLHQTDRQWTMMIRKGHEVLGLRWANIELIYKINISPFTKSFQKSLKSLLIKHKLMTFCKQYTNHNHISSIPCSFCVKQSRLWINLNCLSEQL